MTFDKKYQLQNKIGGGAFSQVFIATLKSTNQEFAVKRAETTKEITPLLREDQAFRVFGNRSKFLVQSFDFFNSPKVVQLVLEKCCGGDLYKYCCEKRYNYKEDMKKFKWSDLVPESDIQKVALNITQALIFLRENNYCHRDIKLDNILLREEGNLSTAVLADFGLSQRISNNLKSQEIKNNVGTPFYKAPEVSTYEKTRPYGYKCDGWSFGVLLFTFLNGRHFACSLTQLSGHHPVHKKYEQVRKNITTGEKVHDFDKLVPKEDQHKNLARMTSPGYDFKLDFNTLDASTEAEEFLSSLLCFDATQRPDFSELLESSWLRNVKA
eukprot:snap_masked-scaffold_31-processed-gene-2.48-mRNA-1 protein AED:0.76 eAED:0.77 QI:0/-1/0/1/-1/1/1/0/324